MELQNNLENKARFFAQYLGSKICYPDTDNKIIKAKLTSVGFDEIQTTYFRRKKHSAGYTVGDILSFNPTNVFHNSDAKNAYLELTPLSEISDEDAIEVSKLLGYITKRTIVRDTDCISIFLYTEDDYDVQPTFNIQYDGYAYFNNGDTWEDNFQRGADVSAYDYLRSKGYALAFHDLSVEDLINYGWIKLKTNGSQQNPKQ